MNLLNKEPISNLEKWIYRISIILAAVYAAVQQIIQGWN